MYELEFIPEKNGNKETKKIDDSVKIMQAALNSDDEELRNDALDCKDGLCALHIEKKFIDARRAKVKVVYRFEFLSFEEKAERDEAIRNRAFPYKEMVGDLPYDLVRPVVVGMGPAGLFAGLILAQYGLRPIIIERGSNMDKRIEDIEAVRSGKAKVNPESNIQFGEGGAGTFSDGKLYSGVSSGLKAFISNIFVSHGAPKEILYDSHPHIGTDRLRSVIKGIRQDIINLGGSVMFDTRFTGLKKKDGKLYSITIADDTGNREIRCDKLILAIGHSSRDTLRSLYRTGVEMESKPFAVGVRIEHLRSQIDTSQYGFDTAESVDVEAANYKLAVDTKTGRKLYTFCMCPGGEVIAAQDRPGSICTNGMSYYKRDLENSNSALLVPVDKRDYGDDILSGVMFQEMLEKAAFMSAGSTGYAPVTRYGDLMSNTVTQKFTKVKPSFLPGIKPADFNTIFPNVILETIKDGIRLMGGKIKGFDDPDAVLTAVEARSSSPVRISRQRDTYESVNVKGMYPCGEGAGYAGGIMSSAIDGINCANALMRSLFDDKTQTF